MATSKPTTAPTLFATAAVTLIAASTPLLYKFIRRKWSERGIPLELLSCRYSEELLLAIDLAKSAGAKMMPQWEGSATLAELDIEIKRNAGDFATAVDRENEEMIMRGISKAFPSHNIIGEEATGVGEVEPLTVAPTWIIDPVDGTTNFAAGLPLCCVSIGFCDGGRPVMGVVYAPATGELFLGVRGAGAYRNGVRLDCRRSKATNEKSLAEAIVVVEFGSTNDKTAHAKMTEALLRVLQAPCKVMRGFGSGVLDLCYVASGQIDLVYSGVAGEGWKPWDYCAGSVLVEEAGGIIQSLSTQSTKFDIYGKSIVCGVSLNLVEECRQKVLGL